MKCRICGHEADIYAFLDEYVALAKTRNDLQEYDKEHGHGGMACPECKWVLR